MNVRSWIDPILFTSPCQIDLAEAGLGRQDVSCFFLLVMTLVSVGRLENIAWRTYLLTYIANLMRSM